MCDLKHGNILHNSHQLQVGSTFFLSFVFSFVAYCKTAMVSENSEYSINQFSNKFH